MLQQMHDTWLQVQDYWQDLWSMPVFKLNVIGGLTVLIIWALLKGAAKLLLHALQRCVNGVYKCWQSLLKSDPQAIRLHPVPSRWRTALILGSVVALNGLLIIAVVSQNWAIRVLNEKIDAQERIIWTLHPHEQGVINYLSFVMPQLLRFREVSLRWALDIGGNICRTGDGSLNSIPNIGKAPEPPLYQPPRLAFLPCDGPVVGRYYVRGYERPMEDPGDGLSGNDLQDVRGAPGIPFFVMTTKGCVIRWQADPNGRVLRMPVSLC